ncbi:MAG: hypothetical protein RL150_40 [Candidatus Parcubacteria bacterium]|jgi:uncharacterized iron-regulated membrane protein
MSTPAAAPAAKNDGVKLLIKVVVGGLLAGLLFLLLIVIGFVVWKSRQQAASTRPLSSFSTEDQSQIFFELTPGKPGIPVRMHSHGLATKITITGNSVVNAIPVSSTGQPLAGAPVVLGRAGRVNLRESFGTFEWILFYLPPNASGPSQVRIAYN